MPQVICDLHIHSRFARGCSKDTTIENLEKYARIKGINLLGTGDFQHPERNKEIKANTIEKEGILRTKTGFPFVWSTEISLMYTQGGKGRRIHFVILAPDTASADKFISELSKKGRLDYDGRPIFGFSAIELMNMLIAISKKFIVIPAHIWTPYFGILGSKSGFDSVEECFGENSKYIYALEMGLSSNPQMNRRLSSLDKYHLVAFSDSHSYWPWRIGREVTAFDMHELTYDSLFDAIKNGKIKFTLGVDPAYGIYHYDGHSDCKVCMSPKESLAVNDICPICKKQMTLGVAHRVEALANRPENYSAKDKPDFKEMLPLHEIIAAYIDVKQIASKKVWEIYNKLIKNFETEFNILVNANAEELKKFIPEKLVDLIIKNRSNQLYVSPGFDGQYGQLKIEHQTKLEL